MLSPGIAQESPHLHHDVYAVKTRGSSRPWPMCGRTEPAPAHGAAPRMDRLSILCVGAGGRAQRAGLPRGHMAQLAWPFQCVHHATSTGRCAMWCAHHKVNLIWAFGMWL